MFLYRQLQHTVKFIANALKEVYPLSHVSLCSFKAVSHELFLLQSSPSLQTPSSCTCYVADSFCKTEI